MSNHSLSLRRRLALEAWRRIVKERRQEHRLTQLMWECTLRCNLKCRHCGSDCRTSALQPDMPLRDFLRVLESIKAHTNPNKVFIVITGGEPLMRADLEQCGRAIYEMGFPWGMVTNGMAMTQKRFRSLLAAGLHTATVSLDGIGDEHNDMRGNARSFDNAVGAIRMMGEQQGFVFDVVTCVNRRNIKQLDQIKELLVSLGVKQWRLFTIFPVGRAAQDEMLQLTKEEYRGLLDYIKQNRVEESRISLSYACEGFLGDYECEVRKSFYTCNAGVNVASVLVDGAISACTSIRSNYHQGNIYKDDFWDVWTTRFEPYRHREWMRTGRCADCNMFRYCEGNGMHLRDDEGNVIMCNLERLE